jgi:UDP-glucose 4-epimerase
VFASTGGAIYGETDVMPTPETVEPRPMAPYGTSKFCAEQYLGLYERLHGMSTVALRFGNVYGPRQDVHGEAGVIAIFCGRLRRGELLRVFGSGEQTRDYIYVGDLVDAIATAGEGDATGAINLGTEEETSVLRVAEILQKHAGSTADIDFQPARLGEIERSVLATGRARDLLGWTAATHIDEGLRLTWEASASA